jgi:hypothetical protein
MKHFGINNHKNYENVKEAMRLGKAELTGSINRQEKVFFDGDPINFNEQK